MMSVNVFAEGENGNNQGLVYYEIITGEKVVLEDNSPNFNKTMEKWVTIASSTFKYFSDDLQLLSVKNGSGVKSKFHHQNPAFQPLLISSVKLA